MLSKENVVDKVEIVGRFKYIQCRHATIISEDGVELSRSFNRHVITPTDDVSNESQEIQDIAAAVHTQEIKDAYTAHLAAQELGE
jgi:hypothetical protein